MFEYFVRIEMFINFYMSSKVELLSVVKPCWEKGRF